VPWDKKAAGAGLRGPGSRFRIRPRFVLLMTTLGSALALVLIFLLGYLSDPFVGVLHFGPPGAESSLELSVPFPYDRSGALSPNGRCYLLVAVMDRSNPKYGADHYGWLPKGATCVGSAATATAVTGSEWPDQQH
jgi:hypothetical protein